MRKTPKESAECARSAHHEAGHAVAVLLSGLSIKSVSIIPDKTRGTVEWYSVGRTCYGPLLPIMEVEKPDNMAQDLFDQMVLQYIEPQVKILMAGEAAQRIYSPHSVRRAHVEGDRELAKKLLLNVVPEEAVGARTDDIMYEVKTHLKEHWAAVEALAKLLIKRGELSGDEVVDCVENAL